MDVTPLHAGRHWGCLKRILELTAIAGKQTLLTSETIAPTTPNEVRSHSPLTYRVTFTRTSTFSRGKCDPTWGRGKCDPRALQFRTIKQKYTWLPPFPVFSLNMQSFPRRDELGVAKNEGCSTPTMQFGNEALCEHDDTPLFPFSWQTHTSQVSRRHTGRGIPGNHCV